MNIIKNTLTGLYSLLIMLATAGLGSAFLVGPLILAADADNGNWLFLYSPHVLVLSYLIGKNER